MGSFPVLLALASLLSLATPVRAGDEPDELMPGRRIVVQPGKLLRVVAKPPIGVTFDLPDAANDPTVEGATLHVFDESSPLLDEATFALPATGWTALRSAGFRYRGAGSPGDPAGSWWSAGTWCGPCARDRG